MSAAVCADRRHGTHAEGMEPKSCPATAQLRARTYSERARTHAHSRTHARTQMHADTRRRCAYLVGSSMRRLSTARGIDDRASRSAYASSIAAAWPFPLTPIPTYTQSHLHPYPLKPMRTEGRQPSCRRCTLHCTLVATDRALCCVRCTQPAWRLEAGSSAPAR